MKEAKRTHTEITGIIQEELSKMDICKRLEFTGSSYEGVKVNKNMTDKDLEFDIMVIMVGGDRLHAEHNPRTCAPGFVELLEGAEASEGAMRIGMTSLVTPGIQSPEDTLKRFSKALEECLKIIRGHQEMKRYNLYIKDHGPARQIDVWEASSNIKLYSVDMVPAYEVDKELYVAKPFINENEDQPTMTSTWRQSFSLEEKEKMKAIDSDKGCRKRVLRVLKFLRNVSTELHPLVSYHLKTAFFKVIRDKRDGENWKLERLGERVVDVLTKLQEEVGERYMSHYWIPEVNLISSWSSDTMTNVSNRLRILCTSETKLANIMTSYGQLSSTIVLLPCRVLYRIS